MIRVLRRSISSCRSLQGKDEYLHGHAEAVLRSHSWRTARNSAPHLLKHLSPGKRVLDVGCGPGTITADFADMVAPDGRVTAIDNAPDALEAAKSYAVSRGVDQKISFLDEDVYSLTFADASFDIVHAHQVLQHLSDPIAALKEMRRVCDEFTGVVAVRDADYDAMTWYPHFQELDKWLHIYRELARLKKGEPDAGRRVYGWAKEAGFSQVSASADVWCFTSAEDKSWWGGTWAERVTNSKFAEDLLETGLVAHPDELEAIAKAWIKWAETPTAWFAVLHGQVVCRP